jgi:predicted XRE-type DNA-binding protein
MNPDILIRITHILEKLNTKQRMIANQLIIDRENSFGEHNGEFCIKTKDGVFNFVNYIKSKCNCE